MVRRVPQQPQDDPGQGRPRLPELAAQPHRQERRLRRDGPRADDGERQHLRQPAGQLLPHRPRPAEPGRDDGPAVLRHPHAVRQVPQPPVRALDAGRLLQHGRLLRPREAAKRPARARRHAQKPRTGRSISTSTAAARSPSRAPARAMAPKFMGGAVPAIAAGKDRREVLADWLTSPDNPFFPKSIVNRIWFHLNGQGHRRSGR